MKLNKILTLGLMAITLPASAQYQEVTAERQQSTANAPLSTFQSEQDQLWNFDWKFQPGPCADGANPTLDDSQWRTLNLPHDMQFELPWEEAAGRARGFKRMCEGWYRKTFTPNSLWQGHQVVLDFGGIMYYGDVYINGTKVASSEYGYIGFEVDITQHLRYGQPNTVAVYANTGKENGSRWYTGGGLYRDVRIKVQNPTHIMRHGIYVSTPRITDTEAEVKVSVDVCNFKQNQCLVRAILQDAQGREIARSQVRPNELTKHSHDEMQLPILTIPNPQRWDLDTPYLYSMRVEVEADQMLVDCQTEQFGVRTIEYSPQFGFKLNGRKVFLKGMANHHDMGALGVAAFDRAIERQMLTMKQFGYNCIRCSHNPYSESLTRIADRLGLLVVDELIDKWSDDEYWGGRQPFMQLWPDLITEWVKRDRNCPSVILWSLGNELQTRTNWSGYDCNDWGITTYNIFNQMVKRWDATRPTTVAQFPARAGAIREEKEFKTYFCPPELGVATEVSSFNYQWDCYPKYFEYAPDMILFQSEAVTNQLAAPFFGMDRNRTVGLAYWGAIEYWGESNKWPKKGWNYSFFSHTLEPYPQAWLIQSAFQPEKPLVHIGVIDGKGESIDWNDVKVGQQTISENWNQPVGSHPNLFTYTNAEEVELLVNGRSLGTQQNDTTDTFHRNMILWSGIDYGKGGTVTAIARNKGQEVARYSIQSTGKAVALKVVCETPDDWHADGMDLQYLRIYAVDSKGRIVRNATDQVQIELSGAADFIALDNGDHYTDELFLDVRQRQMQKGYLHAILRSQRQPGKVTVKLTSPTLKTKTVVLNTK